VSEMPVRDIQLPTPGQTVGPFFRYGLEFEGSELLVAPDSTGAVRLYGRVLDGAGEPVPDALIEIWQTDASGAIPTAEGSLHRSDAFTGWGRVHSGDDGGYAFTTVEPGTGFFAVVVFARGLLDRLHTRIYLPEQPDDALLATLDAEERATLVARRTPHGLEHDIRLQGELETVFLAFG